MGGLDIVIPLRSRSAQTDYGQLTPSEQSNNCGLLNPPITIRLRITAFNFLTRYIHIVIISNSLCYINIK